MSAQHTIRVLVAEDHPVTTAGLVELLRARGLEIVATISFAGELVRACMDARPDVAVVDLVLAEGPAIDSIEALLRAQPALGVVVLTGRHTEEHAFRALRAGVRGYLTKSASADVLLETVRAVARGANVIEPAVAAEVAARNAQRDLTARELDVLRLLANGRSNAEIGIALGISTGTVRTHVSQILEKLTAADRTEAAMIALRRGIV